jgi:hypothetical protein
MATDAEARSEIVEGIAQREEHEAHASFQKALENLWDEAGPNKRMLKIISIEMYGSNPIDMYRVIATKH